jgi:polar amino acid transport system substrate-binding protein
MSPGRTASMTLSRCCSPAMPTICYYPGLAEAAKAGIKDRIVALDPGLLSAEMFVAFSKKSLCRSLAAKFGEGITELTTDGSFNTMLTDAIKAWDAAQQASK